MYDDAARELLGALGAGLEGAGHRQLRATVLGRLHLPGHPDRTLGLGLRVPARMERHDDASTRVDLEDLAVGGGRAVGIGVGQRRARRPVGGDARAVVVADGLVALGDGPPDAVGRGLDVDGVDVVDRVHRALQLCLDGGHGTDDRFGELADPAVVHETDRHRVEEMALLATDLDGRHEAGLLEDPQVLHDPEARHVRQVPAQLPKRLAIALEEPVEQHPPIGIGQCPEDRRRRFGHERMLCDHMVTCQGRTAHRARPRLVQRPSGGLGWLEVPLDLGVELGLGHRADDAIHDGPVAQDDQGRDAARVEIDVPGPGSRRR